MCSRVVNSEVNFNIKYYQYLDLDGNLINLDKTANQKNVPEIINHQQHLIKLYKAMVLARTLT